MDNEMLMRVGVVAVAAVAVVAVLLLLMRQRRTAALRARFGPEYDRVLHSTRTAAEAERELVKRQRRVGTFTLRPLAHDEAEQFVVSWRAAQARFVDDPRGAVVDADRLIEEVMRARGYPVEDAAHRLDDLSVDHAVVVSHYRAGRKIAVRHERGDATTEDLRQAMMHFRALFDELVGVDQSRERRAS
jgi:hypothetical protein